MLGPCSTISTDLAPGLVSGAYNTFSQFAVDGFNLASQQINAITSFDVAFHNWDASWQGGNGVLSGFNRPVVPTLAAITFADLSGSVPNAPTLAIAPIVIGPAPVEPAGLANPPDLNLTVNAPAALSATRPAAAPSMVIPTAPTEPVVNTTLVAPVLIDTTLGLVAPVLSIPEFVEPAPVFTAAVPNGTVNFTETAYVSAMLDKVKATVSRMLDGGTGLPAAIERALFDEAAGREDASSVKVVQEVNEEFASRGFDAEPNGLLAKRVLEVRQTNRNARSEASRAIRLQNANIEVENLRFSVQQGISLEATLLQAHLAVEERKFQVAVKIGDMAIAVFQAYVTQYNSLVLAYNARIDAYKAHLDGLRSRVELFRAEVDAARARGELNQQMVQVYEVQLRAEATKVEVYKAQIEGFRARIDAERARIDGHRSEVEAYKAYVEAYAVEWGAERTRLEAEASRGKLYESAVAGYAARVGVYRTVADVRIEEHKTNLISAQAGLQQHDAQVKTMLARLEAVRTNVAAQTAQGEQATRLYEAQARIEGAAVEADTRAFGAISERENQRIQALLSDARLQIEQVQTLKGLLLRAMESAAQAASQLAGSALSAVNFSAGINSSHSRSESCGTNISYSGEIADA